MVLPMKMTLNIVGTQVPVCVTDNKLVLPVYRGMNPRIIVIRLSKAAIKLIRFSSQTREKLGWDNYRVAIVKMT